MRQAAGVDITSKPIRAGWLEDGTLWVVTEPFEEWRLALGAESWKRVDAQGDR